MSTLDKTKEAWLMFGLDFSNEQFKNCLKQNNWIVLALLLHAYNLSQDL